MIKTKTKQKTNANLYDDATSSNENLMLLIKQSLEICKPET